MICNQRFPTFHSDPSVSMCASSLSLAVTAVMLAHAYNLIGLAPRIGKRAQGKWQQLGFTAST